MRHGRIPGQFSFLPLGRVETGHVGLGDDVLREVLAMATELGLTPCGLTRSPLLGPAGNVEFLAWLQPGGEMIDVATEISRLTGS